MRAYSKLFILVLFSLASMNAAAQTEVVKTPERKKIDLFNGKNLDGWEGNTRIWRVEKGVIVGGSKKDKLPQNEFLATKASYKNFDLKVKFKIKGYEGFINAGVQFHSNRLTNPANEMAGYQADIGSDCMGSLYDESRRDKYLASADQKKVKLKKGWNHYRIKCDGKSVTLWINDTQTITYTETDSAISMQGKIGLQVHGGGLLEVFFKDITLTSLD